MQCISNEAAGKFFFKTKIHLSFGKTMYGPWSSLIAHYTPDAHAQNKHVNTGAPYRSSATSLRNQLGCSTLNKRSKNHTAVWMYQDVLPHTFKLYLYQILRFINVILSSGVYMPRPRTNMLK